MIKVLVVDDELPIRNWLSFCISKLEGFTCSIAQNGKEGYDLFCREKPDIVITDIEMPRVNGIQMLKNIRQLDTNVSVYILTSHKDFSYARDCLKVGAVEYLLKTEITMEDFHQLLYKERQEIQMRQQNSSSEFSVKQILLDMIIDPRRPNPMEDSMNGKRIKFLHKKWVLVKSSNFLAKSVVFTYLEVKSSNKYDKYYYTFLSLNNDFIDMDYIVKFLRQEETRQSAYCAVSDVFIGYENVRKAIVEVNYRFEMKFYECAEIVFTSGSDFDFTGYEEDFSFDSTKALLKQDFAEYISCVESFMQIVKEKRPADIESLKKILKISAVSFINFVKESIDEIACIVERLKNLIAVSSDIFELEKAVTSIYTEMDLGEKTQVFSSQVAFILNYIETHYAEKITLGDVCDKLFYSVEHLSRMFSKEVGIPFVAYVNNLRMKHAVLLLETTSDRINEIAEAVGFSTVSYFSTMFKRKFGQNPYEYKINFQKTRRGLQI